MIVDRFLTTDEDDRYIERTADRLRNMCASMSTLQEADPTVIRDRLKRTNRAAETHAYLTGSAA
jgi:hypothetical protein